MDGNAYATDSTAVAEIKKQVAHEIGRLQDTINECSKEVTELELRLEDVLLPKDVEGSMKELKEDALCPLANRIRTLMYEASDQRAQLRGILSRLEL